MKTPAILKHAKEIINPKEWVKGAAESIGGEVRKGIDENTYSQEESAQTSTARQLNDMQSDSWLSKNVRPIAFLWFMILASLLIFGQINVEAWAQEFIKTCSYMILGWYFGERGIQKIIKEIKKPVK